MIMLNGCFGDYGITMCFPENGEADRQCASSHMEESKGHNPSGDNNVNHIKSNCAPFISVRREDVIMSGWENFYKEQEFSPLKSQFDGYVWLFPTCKNTQGSIQRIPYNGIVSLSEFFYYRTPHRWQHIREDYNSKYQKRLPRLCCCHHFSVTIDDVERWYIYETTFSWHLTGSYYRPCTCSTLTFINEIAYNDAYIAKIRKDLTASGQNCALLMSAYSIPSIKEVKYQFDWENVKNFSYEEFVRWTEKCAEKFHDRVVATLQTGTTYSKGSHRRHWFDPGFQQPEDPPTNDEMQHFIANWSPEAKQMRDWYSICTESAVDNQQLLTNNMCAFFSELFEIKSFIQDFITLLRGNVSVKNLSSLFLAIKYGVMTTISDYTEIAESLHSYAESVNEWKHDWRTCRGRFQASTGDGALSWRKYSLELTTKIYYTDPQSLVCGAIKKTMDWDLWPSLANMWDLVPLSFILDWFVSVSDVLEDIDRSLTTLYLDIIGCTNGYKAIYHDIPFPILRYKLTLQDRVVLGSVDITHYVRSTFPTMPYPPRAFQGGKIKNGFVNWLELSALIVQFTL
ncbi:maturation protein [ssRNA phage AVE015]|uniref:Maturation protein n=1 Tax=ssRNA phage AVE015 TaxID=2785987 RepID=A0A8S5KXJ3_9VIRU|nr:maturation protein [ssRNA phage AVE015]DAD49851.1 TPA_asm: maturation protein [ssRNA phage AVE015]